MTPISPTPVSPAIVHSSREQWLAARAQGIGASEVAAILGVDPRRGALAVYADKVAGVVGETEQDWVAFGRDVEAAICQGYARKTGREVTRGHPYAIVYHPDVPYLGATLDAEVMGREVAPTYPAPVSGPGVLEAKAVGYHKRDDWGIDTAPLHFVVQVQVQMACRRVAWGSLAALLGGIVIAEPVDLLPNTAFLNVALEAVAQFYWRVRNRQPPPPDATEGSRQAFKALYPRDSGATIALPPDYYQVARRIEALDAEIQRLEDEREVAKGQVKLALGENTWGVLLDGSRFQWQVEHRDAYSVPASDHRVLRRVGRARKPGRGRPRREEYLHG